MFKEKSRPTIYSEVAWFFGTIPDGFEVLCPSFGQICFQKVVFDANGADVVGKSVMVQCFVIKLAQCFRSRLPGFYTKSCSDINTNCQLITFLHRASCLLMRESDLLLRFRTSSPHQNLLAPSGALIAIPTYYWSTPPPLFQITPVLNTGLSLSEPLQLYKGYNAI